FGLAGIVGFGAPQAIVEIDVVDAAVAGGGEAGLDVLGAQVGAGILRMDRAGAGIDAQVEVAAVAAAGLGLPHAVVELHVPDVGVALLGQHVLHVALGHAAAILGNRGAGANRQRHGHGEGGDCVPVHGRIPGGGSPSLQPL